MATIQSWPETRATIRNNLFNFPLDSPISPSAYHNFNFFRFRFFKVFEGLASERFVFNLAFEQFAFEAFAFEHVVFGLFMFEISVFEDDVFDTFAFDVFEWSETFLNKNKNNKNNCF